MCFSVPTIENNGANYNWTSMTESLDYLSVTDTPEMKVGFRWQGHIFWNWYARDLDAVDVGNLQKIAQLDKQLGDYQVSGGNKDYYFGLVESRFVSRLHKLTLFVRFL